MYKLLTEPMMNAASPYSGTVSKNYCLVVKKAPKNMAMMGELKLHSQHIHIYQSFITFYVQSINNTVE